MDTPVGRATIRGEPRQTERGHMSFSTGKCKSCTAWHRASPCTSRGWVLPKETWCTELIMSQPYTLVAKKGMKVATDWKEMHSEGVKFQLLYIKIVTVLSATYNYLRLKHYSITTV